MTTAQIAYAIAISAGWVLLIGGAIYAVVKMIKEAQK